ncbi:hypothetical protein GCM10007414_02870 [Agarivorans gilvus]|uniref:NADP-dependent oxidoreductase domain-containing protein n=1 Tax=Agarivorans gilvus TaxID=680279 RepID=A0ABQ1HYD3_9ALTE|nr:hypothetical protein GCM10007414_02870 [Agarivorans gilvus]
MHLSVLTDLYIHSSQWKYSKIKYSILSNKLKMPMLGFGVFLVTDKEQCQQAVLRAIRTGYRMIDTAAVYGNEDSVGAP